jgi:hypothetical protein
MFQFPSFASMTYFTQSRIISISTYGVAPFGNVRIKARLAAPRTLSWPSTSFVASMSLGIRLVPSVAYRILLINELKISRFLSTEVEIASNHV